MNPCDCTTCRTLKGPSAYLTYSGPNNRVLERIVQLLEDIRGELQALRQKS
jgi:hypothetical protein